MPDLSETLALVTVLHEGVQDCSGVAYIEHPIWVAANLPARVSDDDRHIGLAHDAIEDCKERLAGMIADEMGITAPGLDVYLDFFRHRGYSPYVVDGLRLVTRDFFADITYLQWIAVIAESGHRGAIWVKYMDNCHNAKPDRVASVLPEYRARIIGSQDRYARSMAILRPALQ